MIDLDVFSTVPTIICWGDLKDRLYELLGPWGSLLLGENPRLMDLKTQKAMEIRVPLSLEKSYYFDLPVQSTLCFSVMPNEGNLNEVEYLEDYGRNLKSDFTHILAERWQTAGHYYGISSFGGRSEHESRIFVALATAIAEACKGYVILMNDGIFDLHVGIYTPEKFRYAIPKF
jgi:hypothetical protein